MDDDSYFAHLKPRVGSNIFIFKEDDNYYLFAPLSRTYSVINKDMHDLLQLCNGRNVVEQILSRIEQPKNILPAISKLLDAGILVEDERIPQIESNGDDSIYDGFNGRFSIFPSTACNLMCKYCYANGGDNPRYIDANYYKIAMDYFFKNFPSESECAHLSIHGGGEPTLNFHLLKNICDEFKKHSKELSFHPEISITSNGTFGKDVREWLIKEKIGISISMDGPSEIQNYHRPFRSGKASSFDVVINNIRYLIDKGRQVGIRSTVSSYSVSAMLETLEIAKQNGIASIHYEPVFETTRSKKTKIFPPTNEEFTDNLLSCFFKGLEHDIDVSYSGLRCTDYPHLQFCSACGYNFGLTIDGHITTCYEVLDVDDPASECFFIGKVNVKNNTVDLDMEKLKYLRMRITPNLTGCKECFLRFNCAGDCLIKTYRMCNGNIYGTYEDRCVLAKGINMQIIQWIADGVIEPRDPRKSQIFTYDCGGLS